MREQIYFLCDERVWHREREQTRVTKQVRDNESKRGMPHTRMCVYVCVCVREREREGKSERECVCQQATKQKQDNESKRGIPHTHTHVCVCVRESVSADDKASARQKEQERDAARVCVCV